MQEEQFFAKCSQIKIQSIRHVCVVTYVQCATVTTCLKCDLFTLLHNSFYVIVIRRLQFEIYLNNISVAFQLTIKCDIYFAFVRVPATFDITCWQPKLHLCQEVVTFLLNIRCILQQIHKYEFNESHALKNTFLCYTLSKHRNLKN